MKKTLDKSLALNNQSFFYKTQNTQTNDIPKEFCCPIIGEVMVHPVVCFLDGHFYEEDAMRTWLEKHRDSPITRDKMNHNQSVNDILKRNYNLESLISEFNKNKPQLSQKQM